MFSVQRLLDFETLVQEREEGKEIEKSWPSEGRIVFTDVKLRYRPSTEVVLNKLTFSV
jgi:ABC-type bacteriocin/lantibiotic exporter with double-glycine peptidase domain